jgi:hypothetical protein
MSSAKRCLMPNSILKKQHLVGIETQQISIHVFNLLWIYKQNFFFFFIHVRCPDQLTRTTTIPHGPLDILQAQKQVRHRGGDRHAHRGSNPGGGTEQVHDGPQQLDPQALGTHESSNQGTQAGQSLPRPLSYKPRV